MISHTLHLKRLCLSIGLALAGMLYPFAATAATFDLTVEDTIAGFGVEITVEGPDSTDFEVTVVPPRGKDILLSGRTDNRGEAVIEIDAADTERAGTYDVMLENAEATFEVFPGAPTTFSLDTEDGADIRIREEVVLLAGMEDEFGNPIAGRPLLLLADEGDVTKIDDETQEDGTARFSFEASSAGEVTFTVIDVLSEETDEFTLHVLSSSGKKPSGSKLGASLL